MKILIADDERLTASLLQKYLSKRGYDVAGVVSNGLEAVEFLNLFDVDLLLLDINMPLMDGFDTLRAIQGKLESMKVIVFSIYNEDFMVKKALRLGASGFLSKRSDSEDLDRAIEYAFNNNSKIWQNKRHLLYNRK